MALRALIKPLTGVGGHGLGLCIATFRAGQQRLQDHNSFLGVGSGGFDHGWPWFTSIGFTPVG